MITIITERTQGKLDGLECNVGMSVGKFDGAVCTLLLISMLGCQ